MELVHINSCYSFLKTAAGTAAISEATLQGNLGECCVTQGYVFLHVKRLVFRMCDFSCYFCGMVTTQICPKLQRQIRFVAGESIAHGLVYALMGAAAPIVIKLT